MNRPVALLFASLAACAPTQPCPTCPACPACPECPEADGPAEDRTPPNEWFVLHVTDGDTLVARLEGARIERKETIRLLNIDTPEKGEPGFDEATEALKYLVRGARIRLEFENPNAEKRDGFGRLLAYVIVNGENVNVEMVRMGWSRFYTKYGRGRLAAAFEKAESEARAQGKGLWAFP